MFNMLFGEGYALKLLFAFIAVFGLLALALWLVRRFGGERLGNTTGRGRQPRLAVIDAANVDGRRRLVLIRRDNVEHLLIIGGPTDVVVEANIVRVAGATREAPPARPSTIGDALPRAVPLTEGTPWPLQPEPATRIEPNLRPEPAPRHQRPPAPAAEERSQWPEPETAPAPIPRERRTRPEALAGLAEELSRAPASGESERTAVSHRREGRTRPLPTGATPSAGESKASSSADQNLADKNLADMAQRLEAALRRPAKSDDAPSDGAKPEAEDGDMEARPPVVQAQRPPASERSKAVRPEPRSGRSEGKAAGQSSLYDSLEQEMASLLGRPNNG